MTLRLLYPLDGDENQGNALQSDVKCTICQRKRSIESNELCEMHLFASRNKFCARCIADRGVEERGVIDASTHNTFKTWLCNNCNVKKAQENKEKARLILSRLSPCRFCGRQDCCH